MRIRALSCTQPWASLVAAGIKQIETRPMKTKYRGWLAIHATTEEPDMRICGVEPFITLLRSLAMRSTSDLPRGVVIGAVRLTGCTSTEDRLLQARLTPLERELGDYGPGRAAWTLTDARVFPTPIACRGYPWLFPVDVPESWLQ